MQTRDEAIVTLGTLIDFLGVANYLDIFTAGSGRRLYCSAHPSRF